METPKDGGILSEWWTGQQPREGDRHPERYHYLFCIPHGTYVFNKKFIPIKWTG